MKAVFNSVETAEGMVYLAIEEGNTKVYKLDRETFIQANSRHNWEPEWELSGQFNTICSKAFTKIKKTLGYTNV